MPDGIAFGAFIHTDLIGGLEDISFVGAGFDAPAQSRLAGGEGGG